MNGKLNIFSLIGFVITAIFAVLQKWSLPEFSWSTWLAGLVYSWACVVTASLQILYKARTDKPAYEERLPFLRHLSPNQFLLGLSMLIVPVSLAAFRLYGFLFSFYGLFLSVFTEMEPLALFGRNGFINSDFYTPVVYLLYLFWPMALGVVIANWQAFFRKEPWKRIFLPFQQEILRIHLMVLALPFIALAAWALFGDAYQSITIVLLLAMFYMLPGQKKKDALQPGDS